jgi:hypothetical protein
MCRLDFAIIYKKKQLKKILAYLIKKFKHVQITII